MRTCLTFLALLLAGCSPANSNANESRVELTGMSIVISGRIDDRAADKFASLVKDRTPAIRRVVVSSAGGDGPAALRIAKLIRNMGMDVVVDGACVSACAQNLFLAGHRKFVKRGSVIAFHTSPDLLEKILRSSVSSQSGDIFSAHAREYNAFLSSISVDDDIDDMMALQKEPVCVFIDARLSERDPNRYGIGWRFGGFAPTSKQLEEFGVDRIEGSWPTSAGLQSDLRGVGFSKKFIVKYAPGITLKQKRPPTNYRLPLCAGSGSK